MIINNTPIKQLSISEQRMFRNGQLHLKRLFHQELWKNDGEASAAINRVGEERESAGVLGEDVANEQEPKTLPPWFCRIERSEEIWSNFRGYATTVVGDNE